MPPPEIASIVNALESIDMNIECLQECGWIARLFNTKHYRVCRFYVQKNVDVLKNLLPTCSEIGRPGIQEMIDRGQKALDLGKSE